MNKIKLLQKQPSNVKIHIFAKLAGTILALRVISSVSKGTVGNVVLVGIPIYWAVKYFRVLPR